MDKFYSLQSEQFNSPVIGLGLRHDHFQEVLDKTWQLDFVEVHSENFFSKGAERDYLKKVAERYPISLHSTALGLGSESSIKASYLDSLKDLVDDINPAMISDHASFSWGEINGNTVHVGDLLPIDFNEQSLQLMADNINRVQDKLSRILKIENLSAYLKPKGSSMTECEFLVRLTQLTDCELLVDLNNLVVNAHNFSDKDPFEYGRDWLSCIPHNRIGELHLAGFSPVKKNQWAIDDHSQPVGDTVWELYEYALTNFGAVPTLIEWDNQLPNWQTLLKEVDKARLTANRVCFNE